MKWKYIKMTGILIGVNWKYKIKMICPKKI